MSCEYMLLRRQGVHPPGSFPFDDPKSGMRFSSEGGFMDTVDRVLQHRLSNPRVFSGADLNRDVVIELVDCFQCQRLGNDPRFCASTKPGAASPSSIRFAGKFCPDDGTPLTEIYCPTCMGKRVTGRVCNKCGAKFAP